MDLISKLQSDEALYCLVILAAFCLVLAIGGLVVDFFERREAKQAKRYRSMATPNRR